MRINSSYKKASNKQGKAIANAYGDKFIIPLDLNMLDCMIPYYQSGLGNRLCYKITFNDYARVIVSSGLSAKPEIKYEISDVSLEYEIVTQPDLARCIVMKYQSMTLLYGRVLKDRQMPENKSDTTRS